MRVRAGVAVTIWLALAGALAPHAAAATFAVTRTDDPAPDACAPSDCSLREAVLAAGPGDVVQVPAGHYRLSIPGAGEDVGATGDLDLKKNVTIAGAGTRSAVIDAQGIDRVFDVASGVQAQITGVTVTGGQVAGDGGGIRNLGQLGLVQDAIVSNRAQGSGGGIENGGSALILQSLIANNQATDGGGLHGGASNLQTTTVSGNVAGAPGVTGHGGGIDGTAPGSLTLGNSTLTDNRSFNSALTGGGIEDAPYANPYDTILAHNVTYAEDQTSSALSNCADPVSSGGFNLSDGTDCGLTELGDRQGIPVLLGPLADNGGPTDTEAVLPGSLALDSGACAFAGDVDQRGVSRPRGTRCDVGAYELAPPLVSTAAATSVAFSAATLNGTVDPSFRETAVYFEYGRTTAYGSTTPEQIVGSGNGPLSYSVLLSGLRQGVTYHYRLVGANAEGTTVGADQSFTTLDRTKPVLTLLRVGPGLFHRKNGATLAFTLSESATVTFRFDHVLRGVRRGKRCVKITRRNRRRRPCTRYLPVSGSVVQPGAEGPNSIHFDARVGEKLLTFGAYRLRATPKDGAGNVGKTSLAAFRVIR